MKLESVIKKLGPNYSEFRPDMAKNLDDLQDCYLQQIKLLKQLQIAIAIEKSTKKFIVAVETDKGFKVFETDSDTKKYYGFMSDTLGSNAQYSVHETKASKTPKQNLKTLAESGD